MGWRWPSCWGKSRLGKQRAAVWGGGELCCQGSLGYLCSKQSCRGEGCQPRKENWNSQHLGGASNSLVDLDASWAPPNLGTATGVCRGHPRGALAHAPSPFRAAHPRSHRSRREQDRWHCCWSGGLALAASTRCSSGCHPHSNSESKRNRLAYRNVTEL